MKTHPQVIDGVLIWTQSGKIERELKIRGCTVSFCYTDEADKVWL